MYKTIQFISWKTLLLFGYKRDGDRRRFCKREKKANWLHYLKIARQPTGNGSFWFFFEKFYSTTKENIFASATWSRKMSEIKISIHIFIKVFALKSTCTRCAFCENFFFHPHLISYTFLTIRKLCDVDIRSI